MRWKIQIQVFIALKLWTLFQLHFLNSERTKECIGFTIICFYYFFMHIITLSGSNKDLKMSSVNLIHYYNRNCTVLLPRFWFLIVLTNVKKHWVKTVKLT